MLDIAVISAALVLVTLRLPAQVKPNKDTLTRTITVGELTRKYSLHVPPQRAAEHPAALVLVFHGGGGTAAQIERQTKFSDLADREGFLVAYPEGVDKGWNDGRGSKEVTAQRDNIDDIGFVAALIDDVAKAHKLDASRVFATGISNGGIFSHHLAANLSLRIAAIAPVVGGMSESTSAKFAPDRPVSVLILQGTADTLVPYGGGNIAPPRIGAADRRGRIISTDDTIKKWIAHDGCQSVAVVIGGEDVADTDPQDNCRAKKFVYAAGKDGTEVVLYRIEGGGHTWPGAAEPLLAAIVGNVCRDISGTEVIWEFFKAHPRSSSTQKQPSQVKLAPLWITPAIRAPHLQQRTFDSAAAGTKVSYHIYAPESYDTEPERRFPVVYWLHGSDGGLGGIQPLAAHFDAAICAGKIPPMLVVFVNGLRLGMWCDSQDGKTPVETILIKELLPHIDATFRTIAARDGRLIEGFSMGGYGAARLGLKYPNEFSALSMLAGGPLDLQFSGPRAAAKPEERERILQTIYGGDLDLFKSQSPWKLAEQSAVAVQGKIRIRQIVGERDFTLPSNREFDEHLTKLRIPHVFTVVPRVAHDTMALFEALGEQNWEFYCAAFGAPKR